MAHRKRQTHGSGSCYKACYFAAKAVLQKDPDNEAAAKEAARNAMVAYQSEFEMVQHVAETSAVLGFLHAADDLHKRPRRWGT